MNNLRDTVIKYLADIQEYQILDTQETHVVAEYTDTHTKEKLKRQIEIGHFTDGLTIGQKAYLHVIKHPQNPYFTALNQGESYQAVTDSTIDQALVLSIIIAARENIGMKFDLPRT